MTSLGEGLAVTTAGHEGERILWLHPYTMDAGVFTEVWAALPGWRHVGLDLPGHGGSRSLRPGEDLGSIAGEIAAAAHRLGIRHLVGVSLGSLFAAQMAIARPQAFATLVLSAPGLAGGPHDADVERHYINLAGLYRRAGPGPHMTALWMRDPPAIFRHVNRRPELAARLRRVIDSHAWGELRGLTAVALTRPPHDRAALQRIRARTLVLMGSGELPAHRTCAACIVAAVPQCAVKIVPDAGHLVVLEEPAAAAAAIGHHCAVAADLRP